MLDSNNRMILIVDINKYAVEGKLVKESKRIGIIGTFFKNLTLLV